MAYIPHPPGATPTRPTLPPPVAYDPASPPPFAPTPEFTSPRRPPSAISTVRGLSRGRAVGQADAKTIAQRMSSLVTSEERLRTAIEADETRAFGALWRAQLKAEAELAEPRVEVLEELDRHALQRNEVFHRDLIVRVCDGNLVAADRAHAHVMLVASSPLLREHREGAAELFDAAVHTAYSLHADTVGNKTTATAEVALSVMRRAAEDDGDSPQRLVVPRKPPVPPPSTTFEGDVTGGQLRWSAERARLEMHQRARDGLSRIDDDEEHARARLRSEYAFASMEVLQQELSMRYAARRAEAERHAREDVATWAIRFEPDSEDSTLERDAAGQPTAAAIRRRKALLRLQRVGRGYAERRGSLVEILHAHREAARAVALRLSSAQRIQRLVRRFIARTRSCVRACVADATTDRRVFEERREDHATVISIFVRAWLSRLECDFHARAVGTSPAVDVAASPLSPARPLAPAGASQLHRLSPWLERCRAAYIDDEAVGDWMLLPPFKRTEGPKVDGPRQTLASCFDVRRVVVASDAELESEPFASEWAAFTQSVLHGSAVAAVGLDAEWVGERPPALLQICDHERCFLFRLCTLSKDVVVPLVNPLLTATHVFKCGVGLRHDRKKLEGYGFGPLAALLDLVNAAAETDMLPETGRSLEALCGSATGLRMQKNRKVTTSDWEVPELSSDQVDYAADDAIAGLGILAATVDKARRMRFLPPVRGGPWGLRDDEACYQWLKRVAASKPPPAPPRKGADDAFGSPARMKPTNEIDRTPKTGDAEADLQRRLAKLPRPEDIQTQEAKPLYDNIRVLSIAGKHIFTCDTKKAMWYVKKKKLAAITGTEAGTGKITEIQLNFEPAAKTKLCMNWQLGSCPFGDGCLFAHGVDDLVPAKGLPQGTEEDEQDAETYAAMTASPAKVEPQPVASQAGRIADAVPEVEPAGLGGIAEDPAAAAERLAVIGRANACNICLVTGAMYTKFPVIPSHFRRHLPPDLRKARTFDYVPICSVCLPRVQITYNNERRRMWEAALDALDSPAARESRLSYAAAGRLYRYCEMLASPERMAEIPAARRAEIEATVIETFPRSLLPKPEGSSFDSERPDDVAADAAADDAGLSDDERRQRQVVRIIAYVTSYEMADWTHSTEAMDVVSHWRRDAEDAVRQELEPDDLSPARARVAAATEAEPPSADMVEMRWGVKFVRHWRRVFETHMRPIIVPWAKVASDAAEANAKPKKRRGPKHAHDAGAAAAVAAK